MKSVAKIKELTAEHLKKKGQAPAVTVKPTKQEDPDTIMSGDSDAEESKEEKKSAPAKHKNGNRVDQERAHKSKNTVSKSKLANKRTQKEALKKNKMKRNKGTVKDDGSEKEVSEAGASD